MNSWSSYTLQDFIPFTADIYFRLLERMSETFWPLHLLTMALGVVAVWLALKNRARLASVLIAPVWAFVGFAFFIQRYAELNWAGGYIGYCFLAQATLLLLIALTGVGVNSRPRKGPATVIGIAIAIIGLIGLPFIAQISGSSWYQSEVFGIHADPTAITTLGLSLVMLRGCTLWLVAIIPALWLLISGLTLWVLEAPAAILLFALLAMGVISLVWKSIENRFV